MEFCLKVAQTLGLNPIKREIFFIERKTQIKGQWVTKIEPLTSRDGFLSIAHRTGNFAGIESFCGVRETPKLINEQWQNATDLVAVAKVWRKDSDKPTIVEVEFSEYAQRKKDGSLTQFWAKMPKTMLKKVAESQALRKAFNIAGIYGVEEMGVGNADGGELQVDIEAIETKETTEAQEAEILEVENILEKEKKTLESLGLKAIIKDGWIKADGGNVYEKKEVLKQLGYRYFNNKKVWAKKII